MALSVQNVQKLATLSRLTFSQEEAEALAPQLDKIVGFISELNTANTDGITPMSSAVSAAAGTPQRADEVTMPGDVENAQRIAPKAELGFYVVPRVVE